MVGISIGERKREKTAYSNSLHSAANATPDPSSFGGSLSVILVSERAPFGRHRSLVCLNNVYFPRLPRPLTPVYVSMHMRLGSTVVFPEVFMSLRRRSSKRLNSHDVIIR